MVLAVIEWYKIEERLPDKNGKYYVMKENNQHDVVEFTKPDFWLTYYKVKYWGEIPSRP